MEGEKMNGIHKFFAVTQSATTQTSVYVIKDEKNKNNCPIVERVAVKGKDFAAIDKKLAGGSHIGIMLKTGIFLFPSSKRHREPEFINIRQRGKKTPPIVALFLKRDEAMKCFNSNSLQECDQRWKKETLETFNKIGDDHPIFIPSIMEGPSVCYQ